MRLLLLELLDGLLSSAGGDDGVEAETTDGDATDGDANDGVCSMTEVVTLLRRTYGGSTAPGAIDLEELARATSGFQLRI